MGANFHRVVSIVLGTLAGIAGLVSLVGYAIPSFQDLSNPNLSRGTVVLGIAIIWLVTVVAFVMAYRFLRSPRKSR